MVPVPVIEVEEGEFRLHAFLRAYWYLFVFVSLFSALTVFLAISYSISTEIPVTFSYAGALFDLRVVSMGASLLITYLGALAVLWTAFEKPAGRPIFYYFIGIEAFKRLLLVVPLVTLLVALTIWICNFYRGILTYMFSIIGFCAGLVAFSTVLVLISRTARVKNIILATTGYALAVFFASLAILLLVDIGKLPDFLGPVILFILAMGIASVFFIVATLIFEILIPSLRGGK
ncbi:MAG: hypothetical protein QFX32_02275 [Methanolinea sp.]|nr:hypothetical protein [Methanolinea sp.]